MARKRTYSEANSPAEGTKTVEATRVYDIDELDDISSTTSSGMDEDASSVAADVPELECMSDETLINIFEYILLRETMIRPQFKTGTLRNGVYSANEDDDGVSTAPNIDHSLLLINKRLRNIAIDVLYGRNVFYFDNAEICRWWCKQIGGENLAGVRHLNITLTSGWWIERLYDRESAVISPIDCCYEEMWYAALCRLLKATPLTSIVIKLDHWDDSTMWPPGRNSEEKAELFEWRVRVMQRLAKLRGIKKVHISQEGRPWLPRRDLMDLDLLMRQRRRQQAVARPMMGLSELIRNIRLNRLQRESMQTQGG